MIDVNFPHLIKDYFIVKEKTLKDIMNLFLNSRCYTLPVTDGKGFYLGVVNLKDIIRSMDAGHEILIEKDIRTVTTFSDNNEILHYFDTVDQEIIPILSNDTRLIGFYLRSELCESFKKTFQQEIKLFRSILDSSYNGILAVDNQGAIILYNQAAERILGRKRTEVIGRNISYIDPNINLMNVVYTQEEEINIRNVINGYTIMANRTPFMYEGECMGAISVFLDISDLERASHELDVTKKLSKFLNEVIESSYDGLYICNENGIVIRVNNAWEKISGFRREEIIGRYVKDLLSTGLYDNSAALETLKSKKISTTMVEITSGPKKGQKIIATGTPLFGDDGVLTHVVVNVRDITDIVYMKQQLEKTKELNIHYANELERTRLLNSDRDDFIAVSPLMQNLIESAISVAKVDSSVLITGDSGVGKGALVHKIHEFSDRSDKVLITVNCGAIPENLIESELFGYEQGAFTGAKKEGKIGLFELASDGILFLDEIGDLPLNLQVKILNAIQNKEIMRIGGGKPIKIDARIIYATNKNLQKMIEEGKFREDLFYRINVINLYVPPLRDRKEDIPKLIYSIINKLNKKYNINKSMTMEAEERLIQYNWPGNIRQLQNTIERLMILTKEDIIDLNHLPANIKGENDATDAVKISQIIPLKEATEQTERKILQLALNKYRSTRKIAKVLEVDQSTIVRKLKSYKILDDSK
ncbi:MAG: sigma 54-interacting transcriptional regulator [Eubacteriales bacterium]|nr:sigma 54-interacting transcriptional regulator [Eubacteriales bacterium]